MAIVFMVPKGTSMRDCFWKLVRGPAAVARGLLVATFVIAGVAVATTATAVAAGGCGSSGGVPCSPIVSIPTLELTVRGPSTQGHIEVIETGAATEADAEAAEAEAGAAGTPMNAKAVNSIFTFKNRNSSGKKILFKFFSKTRNWVWPSATSAWVAPPDRVLRQVRLLCQKGEKVCLGGWWPSNPNVYWGVGPQGNQGCAACCWFCNGGFASVNFVYR